MLRGICLPLYRGSRTNRRIGVEPVERTGRASVVVSAAPQKRYSGFVLEFGVHEAGFGRTALRFGVSRSDLECSGRIYAPFSVSVAFAEKTLNVSLPNAYKICEEVLNYSASLPPERQCIHIHTVLHLNKGDDNTRGHPCTELNNKAETVLQITKDGFDRDISSVAAMHIRDRDFEPFAFRINADALTEPVEDYRPRQTTAAESFDYAGVCEAEHREALELLFSEGRQGFLFVAYRTVAVQLCLDRSFVRHQQGQAAQSLFGERADDRQGG